MSYYIEKELKSLGFAHYGEDVRISKKASIYNTRGITLGNHVRIDDFCVLSAGDGGIEIGDYVHISVFCSILGNGRITMADFSSLAARGAIYSSNDDYSGEHLIGPTVPIQFRGVTEASVSIGKFVVIAAGAIVLPGVTLEEGVAIGALSLVNTSCSAFGIYAGVPVRRIGDRSQELLELEKQLRKDKGQSQGHNQRI